MHAAAARYVSVSELYSTDEVELLLDEIRDLEPTSCRGEDAQDFEIAGSGAGAAGGLAGGAAGGGGDSGARSPAGTERSWDSHAHYSRAPPPPPRPLAPVYCRLRYLLTPTGAATLCIVVCSALALGCVWGGAGLRVWALPGAGAVRLLQLGAATAGLLHAALLLLRVTRLDALLPLRWDRLALAAAAWSAGSLLAGASASLHALLTQPAYRAAPSRLCQLLYTATGLGLGAALASLAAAALALRACAGGRWRGGGGGRAGGSGSGGRAPSAASLAAYRAVPQPSTSRHDPL